MPLKGLIYIYIRVVLPCLVCIFWYFLDQEKESNSKKGYLAVVSPWFTLISSLSVLAEAEKTYSSFSFVVKKRFRKDVSSEEVNKE
jgi:hypothetical protein